MTHNYTVDVIAGDGIGEEVIPTARCVTPSVAFRIRSVGDGIATRDLGGTTTTEEFSAAVLGHITSTAT